MGRIIVFLILVNLMTPPLLWAQDIPVFDKNDFIASADTDKTLKLTMADCVEMALKKNSEIQVTKIYPLIADADIMIEKATFEPDLSANLSLEDDTELSTTTLFSRDSLNTRTHIFDVGYGQKFITGTQLAVDFYNTRTDTNSLIATTNPLYDSKAEITITQPLLRGFGILVNKADLLIATNNKLKSKQDLIGDVINILTDVKQSYYDFQYTLEQYNVAQTSLKRTQELLQINNEKYAKGLASNVDVLESESEVARLQQAVAAAEGQMRLAADSLKLITNLVDDPELWNAHLVLLENMGYEKKEPDLVEAINTAFEHRPDYEAAKIDLKNKDISVAYYKNGLLPTVDLVGSYGLNGLGRTYNTDMDKMTSADYPDWSVGVSINIPLGNQEERGKYEKSKLQKRQALIGFKRLEQKIILEVRDAVRNVDIKYRMLEASLKSKEAEGKNYAAQEERFRAGLVSTLDIVTYQERLARAELNYVKSIIDYNLTLIQLAKTQGTMLINDNITIE